MRAGLGALTGSPVEEGTMSVAITSLDETTARQLRDIVVDAFRRAEAVLRRPPPEVAALLVQALLRHLSEIGIGYARQLDMLIAHAQDIGTRMGGDASALLAALTGARPHEMLARLRDKVEVVRGDHASYPLAIEILGQDGAVTGRYSARGAIAALEVWLARSLSRIGGTGWRISDGRRELSRFDALSGLPGWTLPAPSHHGSGSSLPKRQAGVRNGLIGRTRTGADQANALPDGRKEPVFEALQAAPTAAPDSTYRKIERQKGPAALIPRTVSMGVFESKIHITALRELLDYWDAVRAGRRMPARRDMDPTAIPFALNDIAVVSVGTQQNDRFRFRLVGANLSLLFGPDAAGKPLLDLGLPAFARHSLSLFETAVSARGPALSNELWRAESNGDVSGQPFALERIVLPLANDGREVNFLIMCLRPDTGTATFGSQPFERANAAGTSGVPRPQILDSAALYLRD